MEILLQKIDDLENYISALVQSNIEQTARLQVLVEILADADIIDQQVFEHDSEQLAQDLMFEIIKESEEQGESNVKVLPNGSTTTAEC